MINLGLNFFEFLSFMHIKIELWLKSLLISVIISKDPLKYMISLLIKSQVMVEENFKNPI